MKVITIGRGHDNDVRIDDPYVGRHHCQIVQHDNGMFAIVDINSTNGTFVNGRRVFGEAQLQPYDSVTIGNTTLPWVEYFSPKTESYALPIVLGCVGWVVLTIVLTLLIFKHGSDKAFAFKGEYPDAVVVNMLKEDGIPYTIEAIEGQVCVWFEEGVPYKTAKQSIKVLGGRIVAQIPENGYYLVEVPADKVQIFLKRITKENFVDWAYPNMISYSSAVNNYILDNYYPNMTRKNKDTTPHGKVVQKALEEYGLNIPLRSFNIGDKNGKNLCKKELGNVCVNSEFFALDTISSLYYNSPIFINMSYGPSLPEHIINGKTQSYYWDEATDREQSDYQNYYVNALKKTIMNLKPLEGKDYVVVVAAGNEGVKSFAGSIIAYLRKELTDYEKETMDKHFIIVTAGEEKRADYYSGIEEDYKNKYDKAVRYNRQDLVVHYDTMWHNAREHVHFIRTYSNEMEIGLYDPWVTKVDISDFKYEGKDWYGTSFAAPRATGILSSVANEMNLTGLEILEFAREVTKRDGELTKEALLETAKNKKKDSSKEITIEGVLRMYLLNSSGGGNVTYYTDAERNVIDAVGEEDTDNPYCQTIYEYRETDFDNTYLAFVIEADNAINVIPYLEAGDDEFLDNSFQSAIMLVPQFQYNGKDFAEKYANKWVRATGTLYVPGGGWRNATVVVMRLSNLELLDKRGFSDIKKSSAGLLGTKWLKESQTTERHGVMFKSNRMEWEFLENGFVEITIFYDSGAKEINLVYKYYFDKESNNWIMWDWGAVEQIGRLEGETNETVLRERAYKQGLYYTITLSGNNLIATDFSGYEKYVFTRVK